MLGSILSNLLLVLGMCFFLGGVVNMRDRDGNGSEQVFASGTAQTTCSLMTLSTASMIIPATLFIVLEQDEDKEAAKKAVLLLSRGTAVILLLMYGMYLYFQLKTHKNLFSPEIPEVLEELDEEETPEEEAISALSAAAILVGVTVIISFCADYLVDAIDPIVATGAVSKNFIGLILIPIVGNAAEHVTACVVAIKDKMDLVSLSISPSSKVAKLTFHTGYGCCCRIQCTDCSPRHTMPRPPWLGDWQAHGPPV